MRETIGNLFNHLFSLRQSLFSPVLLGHILLATLVHSGCWKDIDGALRGSFIFTYLMNNNIILVYLLGIEYQISELDLQDCPILPDCFLYWLILCDLYIFSFESFFRNMHCKYSLKVCTLTFHPLSIDIQHRHFNIYLHFHKKLAWKFYLFILLNTLKHFSFVTSIGLDEKSGITVFSKFWKLLFFPVDLLSLLLKLIFIGV